MLIGNQSGETQSNSDVNTISNSFFLIHIFTLLTVFIAFAAYFELFGSQMFSK